jgi:hypothetical protein
MDQKGAAAEQIAADSDAMKRVPVEGKEDTGCVPKRKGAQPTKRKESRYCTSIRRAACGAAWCAVIRLRRVGG